MSKSGQIDAAVEEKEAEEQNNQVDLYMAFVAVVAVIERVSHDTSRTFTRREEKPKPTDCGAAKRARHWIQSCLVGSFAFASLRGAMAASGVWLSQSVDKTIELKMIRQRQKNYLGIHNSNAVGQSIDVHSNDDS